ncbi:MAG TPA: ATP-grasp domain-containing protein [Flavisolibacter sp.]|jgi:carbamoyl-phosphate synthase large subunit|nr:ATP-grasp domain-containing protein [Flavisolibacter sp.]
MQAAPMRILMTGAGAPGAPGIIQCLLRGKNVELVTGDADADAIGRYLHPDFIQLPRATDSHFAEQILHYCSELRIQFLLPLVTRELLPLSRYKEQFLKAGIKVLVSSPEALEIANNKSRTYSYLREKGIPVPAFFTVRTLPEFEQAADWFQRSGDVFCFKPSQSNGSRGFRIVSDTLDQQELLFGHKPYQTYISYKEAVRILSQRDFPELLVSAYLPGVEYSVDCLANQGTLRMAVPRTREKMINGISVKGRFERQEAIIEYCREIIESIGLHGNIGLQVKLGASGAPLLLEINPRVQGTIVACLGAGINLPLEAINQEAGLLTDLSMDSIKWGTRFSRYWTEQFY